LRDFFAEFHGGELQYLSVTAVQVAPK
jgi:hypothetical protein